MQMMKQAASAAASAAAQGVVNAAVEMATPPTPPPPKVWCVTLRRNPPLTDEDYVSGQPLGACQKNCWLAVLGPPALLAYAIGWMIYTVLQCIACVLTPLLGPAVLQEIAARRLALLREKGNKAAAQQAIQDAKQAAGCAMCLVNLMWCTYTELITPLNLLCAW